MFHFSPKPRPPCSTGRETDGQALDVNWYDAQGNNKDFYPCNGQALIDALDNNVPAPIDGELTGIGTWTAQQFVDTIRNGRHQGRGRQLLPPMPWQVFAQMTDEDLRAMFAYLRTITPVKNKVPDPLPPASQR